MPMYNPPHPGQLLKHQLIKDEDGAQIDSIANVAHRLGCHRNTLNQVLRGATGITPRMAVSLERIGAGSAEMWLKLQAAYDLFQIRSESAA